MLPPRYPASEWKEVSFNIEGTKLLWTIDTRANEGDSFGYGNREYHVTVNRIPPREENSYVVQILNGDTTVVSPSDPNWDVVWNAFLIYKADEGREINEEVELDVLKLGEDDLDAFEESPFFDLE